jgi:hypothetical protein
LSYVEQLLAAWQVDPPPPDLSRQGVATDALRRPGGPIVDPAVSDRVRMAEALLRRPHPGDPAATDRVRLAEALLRRPHPGDPAASDHVRLAELLLRRPPHGDPAVSDRVRLEGMDPIVAEWIARLLAGVDPPPEDIARLTVSEIEGAARTIAEDIVRLKSIEGLLNARLKELKETKAGGR